MTKAARAFARAVQADPAFAQPTIDLARTALAQRIQPRLDVALEAVRLAAASPAGRNPRLQLARGRVERGGGDPDSALAAFGGADLPDRKSTRLNSSHLVISYAVFCFKKKK